MTTRLYNWINLGSISPTCLHAGFTHIDPMCLERYVEHSQKVNKFFHRSLRVLAPFDDVIKWRVAGGCNAYLVNLVNSKSNCKCCMVFRDLLFVSNTSYVSKIDEMREVF